MRRPRLPFARRRAEALGNESPPSTPAAGDAGAGEAVGDTEAVADSPKPSATPEAPADPQERIDGLRAWVAQVDRKLGVRTYVGAAIAVLALAAAAVGLVLTLSLKQDAATDDDVASLRDQISAVEQSASEAAQEDVQALERRLTELEAEVNSDLHPSDDHQARAQGGAGRHRGAAQPGFEADSSSGDASQGSSGAAPGAARRPVLRAVRRPAPSRRQL